MSVHPKLHPRSEKLASILLAKFGTVFTAFVIILFSIFWIGWNSLAPAFLKFDPAPSFVIMLLISNFIQLFLQPLVLVSNNLQESANAKRAEDLQTEISNLHKKVDLLLDRHPFR